MDIWYLLLCMLLGHNSFYIRELAETELRKQSSCAWLYMEACVDNPDPEIQCRLGRLVSRHRQVWLVERFAISGLPCLDALPLDIKWRDNIIERFGPDENPGQFPEHDIPRTSWRIATLKFLTGYIDRYGIADTQALISRMEKREELWIPSEYRYSDIEPIPAP